MLHSRRIAIALKISESAHGLCGDRERSHSVSPNTIGKTSVRSSRDLARSIGISYLVLNRKIPASLGNGTSSPRKSLMKFFMALDRLGENKEQKGRLFMYYSLWFVHDTEKIRKLLRVIKHNDDRTTLYHRWICWASLRETKHVCHYCGVRGEHCLVYFE